MIERVRDMRYWHKPGSLMVLAGVAWLQAAAGGAAAEQPVSYGGKAILEQSTLFSEGQDGYHTFRIPALMVTSAGSVLAFCEGRKNNRSDSGNIDVVLKRSMDAGRTWSPMTVVADDGPHTIGNPCPVQDRRTGIIHLLLTRNLGSDEEHQINSKTAAATRTVWISRSRDDGLTWSKPVEITHMTKRPEWSWYATGPGCGIQLRTGRLLIPCDHNITLDGKSVRRSHVIYSDDSGESWHIGGIVGNDVNECQVVERTDGSVLIDMRNYAKHKSADHHRAHATSNDGGLIWSPIRYVPELIEPICQASIVRFTARPAHAENRILFANPASTKREKMTVRMSRDEGASWPLARTLYEGPSAYSALAILPDMTAACLYECGEKSPYERITFARFSVEWLSDGKDRL